MYKVSTTIDIVPFKEFYLVARVKTVKSCFMGIPYSASKNVEFLDTEDRLLYGADHVLRYGLLTKEQAIELAAKKRLVLEVQELINKLGE